MDYSKFRISARSSPWFDRAYDAIIDEKEKKRVDSIVKLLCERPDAGDRVQKNRWPPKYVALGLNNLWRIDVTYSSRLTYFISLGERDLLEVVLIEYFPSHKEYEKRFGY